MEQRDGRQHECPTCAPAQAEPTGGWSRRALLRLGLATSAGAAAAAAGIVPAFARAVSPAERETSPPGAARALTSRPAQPNWPVPQIVTRAEWGANEALRKGQPTYNSVVEKIVVHHTASPTNPSDPAGAVRGIYEWSVSAGGYYDIAYHFLIDQNGRIYEGRWARDYAPGVPHVGENTAHQSIQGAATLAHNPRTIAIAMLGTFTDYLPTPAALTSLNALITWKCARWGIDPNGATPYLNTNGVVDVLPDIFPHRSVFATTCPGNPLIGRLGTIREQVDERLRTGTFGYWIAGAYGTVSALGDVPVVGDPRGVGVRSLLRSIVAQPSRLGYWALGTDGGVFCFGNARFFGSMGGRRLNRPVVGMASTLVGNGYWLVASDGGIFCFGDARFFGSTGAIHLNQPIVGIGPTVSGNGYWLVARDGGIFCFGDARFFGSTGGIHLNQPIVAMCVTPSGNGYWLVARDGGIFCFGDATFYGSGPGRGLRSPAVAMAATMSGRGYALLATDGTVLPFGDARSYGSATGIGPVVGFAGRLLPA